ncbi:hypothetical protein J9303_00885 [Bacillaceae bacterium Marseille-Q3522]|nr:hypothetical protein [Bacillaceae bacterium Marseille-Q3522]
MKSLSLFIDGKEKKFTIPFVNGMVWRKYIEWKSKVENLRDLTVEEIDELASLVVYAFKDQFTLEQFYEGVPHDKVMRTVDDLFLPTDEEDSGSGKK